MIGLFVNKSKKEGGNVNEGIQITDPSDNRSKLGADIFLEVQRTLRASPNLELTCDYGEAPDNPMGIIMTFIVKSAGGSARNDVERLIEDTLLDIFHEPPYTQYEIKHAVKFEA